MMSRVWIRFLSREDEVKSFFPLIKKFSVDTLPGNIFCIPEEALHVLEETKAGYKHVPHDEVVQAVQKLWDFRLGKINTKKQKKLILKSNPPDTYSSEK